MPLTHFFSHQSFSSLDWESRCPSLPLLVSSGSLSGLQPPGHGVGYAMQAVGLFGDHQFLFCTSSFMYDVLELPRAVRRILHAILCSQTGSACLLIDRVGLDRRFSEAERSDPAKVFLTKPLVLINKRLDSFRNPCTL